MRASADPGLVKRLSVFASAASVFAIAIGLSVLAGWTLGVAVLITWGLGTPMAPNAAACTVLAGICLWLRRKYNHSLTLAGRFTAQTTAAIVAVVGLLTLAEHVFSLSFGIDRLLLRTPLAPQLAQTRVLMSPIAAGHFLLLGLALLVIDWRTRRDDWPAQFLCLGAAISPAFGLLGVLLGPKVTPITLALPAVVSYFLLACGLIGSRATWALGGLLTSQNSGARLLRRATPAALIVLSFIGWLISKPLLTDSHFTWVQVSVLAVFSSAALAGFIAWVAFIVDRSDTQRRKIEEAFAGRKEELDRILNRIEEPEAEALLRRKVEAGFVVAVLLTSLLGILSWRANRQAAEDADWVAHTQEVSTTLELTLRHLLDVETGGRGFALTGDEVFLGPYEPGKAAVTQDLQRLSTLIADNPDQRRRLDLLRQQTKDRIEFAESLVISRQLTGNIPHEDYLLLGKQLMDSTRATVAEMEAEENRLLEQRSQRARSAQRLTISVITLGSVGGVVFLSIAGFTVSREIGVSARARALINVLNANLERRVAERTEALGESEGRLSSIIQSAMDSIITTDDQQRILVFNKAAETMFRCPAAEVVGQSITRFIPERFQAAHHGHFKKFAGNGSTTRTMGALGTLWGVRADGEEFRIEASISHIRSGGKNLSTVILRDITERVRAEALREHLASVVDSSDDAIISKDLNGIINAWNRGAEKIFGYTAAEAMGRPMTMLFPPGRVYEEADILARIGGGESVEHFETARVRKDGKKIDVSVTISPIRDSSGRVVGASKIARDITERKRAEDALREQAEIMDSAQVFVRDIQSRVVYWPKGAEKLYGFTRQEAVGILSHDLFHTKFPEPLEMVEKKLFETGMWEGELIHTRRDGSIIVVSSAWVLHRDRQGQPVRILETNVDITARKQAEAALHESEERFRTLIEQASDAFFLHDGDGRFLEVNREACESLGYTREELLRMGVFDVEQEVDERKARQAWEQAEPRRAYTIQGRQRRKDGTAFPIEARLSAYYVDGKKLHLGLVRDITERMRAQEALRRSDAGRVVALEAANLGEWEIDLSTGEARRSWRHDQIFGYASPPEWSMEIFLQHVHPDDRARARTNLEVAISQGTKLETECRIVGADGEMRWIRACGDRYHDASGQTTRMFGTVEDITERKNAAEALRISEERLRLAMDGARMGTWHWNMESGELAWSPRCVAMFGLPPGAEMSYEIFRATLHPDDRVPTDEAVQRSLAEHSGYDIEYRAIWPDGSQHWIAAKGQGHYDAAGKATRMEGVVTDVTERREAQERLRKSEEDYRTLFDSMDEGFCTIEVLFSEANEPVDYRFVEVNPAFQKQAGMTNAVGRTMREIAPEHEEYWFQIYGKVALTGEPARFENFAGQLNRWFDINAFRVGEPAGMKVAVLFNDITERKRNEAELRENEERFRLFIEHAPAALAMFDREMCYLHSSRRWRSDYGLGERELRGLSHYELFPEMPERWKEVHRRALAGEVVRHENDRFERADGSVKWLRWEVRPWRDGVGAIAGILAFTEDITERKQADDARLLAEERYRRFVERTAAGVLRNTLDGRILESNDAMVRMLGYDSRAEFLSRPHPEIHYVDPEERRVLVERLKKHKALTDYEACFKRKDGSPVWVVMSLVLVEGEDEAGDVLEATVIDVTARKQAEQRLTEQAEELSRQSVELARTAEALEAQSAMLKLILESVGEGLIAADREGRFIIWNDSAKKLMGRDSASLPSDRWTQYYKVFLPDGITPYPPERLPLVRALRGESAQVELMVEQPDHADGVFLEVTARPMKDADGNLCGGVAVLRDITEHKRNATTLARQAEELRQSQRALETQTLMLQSVLDSIDEGLVAADENGKFILWNPAATRIVGMGAENVTPGEWNSHYGVYLPDTITPLPDEQNPLARAIHGEVSTAEIFIRNPELEEGLWLEISGGPLKSRDGAARGGVVAFRDITQRKKDEREIHKLNEELEERVEQRTAQLEAANKELEAFTYSVSHDLRAPLRHIGGFSKILMEDFGPGMPTEAQAHLQRIEDGARRMGLLVDELLNLARVGRHALQLQAAPLKPIVEDVVCLLQPEINGRAVTWKIADLFPAQCDPILIKQVFQNLIANALKFTRTRNPAVIEISQRQENGETVIAVSDNGVGFNMKFKDKLFGVFQRLHRAEDFEGTGIGLATAQRIIRKHGGRIWAEAELDKGATFFFTLATAESVPKKPDDANLNDANLNDANLNKDQPVGTAVVEVENKSAAAGAQI